jgi:hypothetical protein
LVDGIDARGRDIQVIVNGFAERGAHADRG